MPAHYAPINLTTSALTLDFKVHGSTMVTANRAAGWTITLPTAAGTGVEFEVFVGTALTANGVIQVGTSADTIHGGLCVSTDAAGVAILTGTADDTITLNSSTTGGLKGSFVKLKDVGTGLWRVDGFLISSGSEATPFSAAV